MGQRAASGEDFDHVVVLRVVWRPAEVAGGNEASVRDDAVQVRVMPKCPPPSEQHGEKGEVGLDSGSRR